ncbi:MAG: HAMP domain-containing sensor histidine kinase [Candidatus Moranbacteria bacterium]|nr:HAMP domain-containing sensor histidine kinase [Candidatus Moranbacteria bacterium]
MLRRKSRIGKMKKELANIFGDLNIKKQAEDLGVSVWETPSFLFILMGMIIMVVMAVIYFISRHYESPELLIVSESLVVIFIFTVGNVIIRGVENVARINKMKSEFVSIASHQLKTPLTQLNWEIELLLSRYAEGLTKKQLDIIKDVSHSHLRMAKLTNDLLDVARIDQGKMVLLEEKFDLLKLVEDVIQSEKNLAEEHNVKVKVNIPAALPEIKGDKRRTGVVVDNLLSNAIKYTDRQGEVEVSVERKDATVTACIKDNGVGIPKYQQDQVFQKFFRSDNAARYQEEGTGLGLYIAKNIIEQSGGKLWFQSEENIGSTFCLSLPLEPTKAKGKFKI